MTAIVGFFPGALFTLRTITSSFGPGIFCDAIHSNISVRSTLCYLDYVSCFIILHLVRYAALGICAVELLYFCCYPINPQIFHKLPAQPDAKGREHLFLFHLEPSHRVNCSSRVNISFMPSLYLLVLRLILIILVSAFLFFYRSSVILIVVLYFMSFPLIFRYSLSLYNLSFFSHLFFLFFNDCRLVPMFSFVFSSVIVFFLVFLVC